jgi:4-amino-4-deoxy-L-arabinose transferase-like glycosyltransferase
MIIINKDKNFLFISLSLAFYIFTSLTYLYLGKIHVDEPFYFTISNLINDNYIPYRDFFYTQTPLFPYIFSLPQKLFGHNLYIGRLTSIFFGLLTFLLVTECAWKIGNKSSAVIASALIGFNPFLIYHFTFVKLYSLLAFLLILTVRFLLSDLDSKIKYPIIALILSVGTATRITLLPTLVIVGLFIILIKREIKPFIGYIISCSICNLIIFTPFIMKAKDQIIYGVWGYLMDRDVLPISGIFKAKFLFLSEFSRHFSLFFILLVIASIKFFSDKRFKEHFQKKNINEITLSWILLIILALPHILTKISYVCEYLSFLMPLLALLTSFKAAKLYDSCDTKDFKTLFPIVLLIASLITWTSNIRDFIRYKNKIPPVKYINQVSEYLETKTKKNDQILSFNNAIVILSDRKILPGYEMNSCSFDPAWNENRCKKHRILNVDMLSTIIKNKQVGGILITENTFLGNFPSFYNLNRKEVTRDTLMPLIKKFYTLDRTFPDLGNMSETAYLYLPGYDKPDD